MKNFFQSLSAAFILAIGIAAPSASAQTEPSIVDIAASDSNFSSLVDAVVAQDLVDTLAGEGPFTVFAPTNQAFTRLPRAITKAVAIDPTILTDILLSHVVAGDVRAADVVTLESATAANGSVINIRLAGNNVFVGSSKVTATDIVASNGVIHVVDRVMIPREIFYRARDIIRSNKMSM